jgi:hypothetical protein
VYLQYLVYNQFGKQITQNWYNETVSTPLVKRGYTGHEHIKEYADFGNFNFGATSKAIGLNETFSKFGAGMAQVKAGTSKSEWLNSFYDDPEDQYYIELGFAYYEYYKYNKKYSQ